MHMFSHPNIHIATAADIDPIKQLLNSAYRGESSKQGWTTEALLIEGDVRTDNANLLEVMEKPGSILLKYVTHPDGLVGCVNLQQQGPKIYLGMFCVSPYLQGKGIGKKILLAAEAYAKYLGCGSIYMSVISVRGELIEWYQRQGYIDTGQRKAFTEDGLTGKHRQPLEFIILEKRIA
jgi:ribosomal protein S18 acetylase RimI-like enzyme